MLKLYVLLFLSLFTGSVFAQSSSSKNTKNRPTIGLVLSGGGAKGFAHIGAIKLLEEAGIKPDYITGTSMGSIVGALYAMGYSVKEMEQISDTTDWGVVLSNTVRLNEITVTEKAYYGTFLTELDINKTGVSLPGGLIEGQNLLEKLSVLSRPVHGINSFLDFPIPFTCVATDIVNGVPVALNSGNITDAIRASMAIPTAFTPVEIDTMLLIDGGWTRNLPVQEAKDMGADIIISIDVGASLLKRDELQSMISILDQTAWLLSVQDTKKQLENSDYVISPNVSMFSTFDFDKADTIIAKGYEEALKQKAVFVALAKKIYPSGKYEREIEKPFFESRYSISNIAVEGTKLTSKKFVSGRLELDKNKTYSSEEIAKKVGMLYGTLYYKNVSFELVPLPDSTQELRIKVVEDNPAKLKFSFYYDTENSIGINLNVTLRNLLLKDSRLIFDSFISENPVGGVKYFKYFGQDQKGFLFGEIKYTKDSRYEWENLYLTPAGFNYREVMSYLGGAYTIEHSAVLGGSMGYLGAKMTPTTNPDTIVSSWNQSSFPVNAFFKVNTFNQAVFPNTGIKLSANVGYNFNVTHTVSLKPEFELLTQDEVNDLVYVEPHMMFKFGYQQYIPFSKKFSLFVDTRMVMSDKNKVGFNDYSKVGGVAPILSTGAPFWGVNRNEINVRQFAMASLGFQWKIYGEIYFKGKLNYLNTEYPMVLFSESITKEDFTLYNKTHTDILGYGLELAYNSAVGPVRFVVTQNQYHHVLNVFVGIGYNIYRSEGDF